MSADEYRWQWRKPDRPGVWLRGHAGRDKFPSHSPEDWRLFHVGHPECNPEGWWCFLMDLPEILPPKKKTVWRMWMEPYIPADPFPSRYRPVWITEGRESFTANAIRTDKTEEREE